MLRTTGLVSGIVKFVGCAALRQESEFGVFGSHTSGTGSAVEATNGSKLPCHACCDYEEFLTMTSTTRVIRDRSNGSSTNGLAKQILCCSMSFGDTSFVFQWLGREGIGRNSGPQELIRSFGHVTGFRYLAGMPQNNEGVSAVLGGSVDCA